MYIEHSFHKCHLSKMSTSAHNANCYLETPSTDTDR